ncbi:MAG: VOC family protein [Trebonia sp.]
MSVNAMKGFPAVLPRLRYEDLSTAVRWLCEAFGFSEHLRWANGKGLVQHAEIRLGDVLVELSAAHDEYEPPKRFGKLSQSLILLVDDVDDHHARARAAGAHIITKPADMPWGLRQYTADDLAGHRWEFAQYMREVPAAEWGAVLME